jgi:hypothetical protein
VVYTGQGLFDRRLQPLGEGKREGPSLYLPAHHGDQYLSLQIAGPDRLPVKGSAIWIHRRGEGKPLSKIANLDPTILGPYHQAEGLAFDRRLHYLPEAGLLVLVPAGNRSLLLHRVKIEGADQR